MTLLSLAFLGAGRVIVIDDRHWTLVVMNNRGRRTGFISLSLIELHSHDADPLSQGYRVNVCLLGYRFAQIKALLMTGPIGTHRHP